MELDYRTGPRSEAEETTSTVYMLALCATVALLATIVIRLAAVFAATWLFLTISLLIGGVLALYYFVLSDESLARSVFWLFFGPVLSVCGYLVATVPHPVLLAIPIVAGAWLAHQVVTHYAEWMLANPFLARKTRMRWRNLWAPKGLPGDAPRRPIRFSEHIRSLFQPNSREPTQSPDSMPAIERTERRHYPFGIAIVFVSYLLAILVLMATSTPFIDVMLAVFTFVVALIAWGVYDLRQYDRTIDPLLSAKIVWNAIVSWLNYNTHDTPAPGVFQSPCGRIHRRRTHAGAVALATAVIIIPLGSYLPVCTVFVELDPWLAAYREPFPWEGAWSALTEESGESTPSTTTLTRLDDVQRAFRRQLPPSERKDYVESCIRKLEQQDDDRRAYTALVANPEGVVFASVLGAIKGKPFLIASLFFSLVACLIVPLIIVYAICFGVGARVLTHHWLTLEGDDEHPARYHPTEKPHTWAAYVGRLRDSRHRTTDQHDEQLREADHLLLGFSAHGDYPVLLDRKILSEHTHITGDSGSGKTALALAPMLAQLIGRPRSSVVVLDLNGEMPLFVAVQEALREANAHRKQPIPFRWFTNFPGRSTYVFNPFLQSHIPQVTTQQNVEVILQSIGLEYGEGYGPAWFSSAHRHVLATVLEQNPELNSFRRIDRYTAKTLPTTYKELGITKKQYEEASHLYTVVHALASFEALNATPDDGYRPEVFQRQIDMFQVVQQPEVIYFSLASSIEERSVAEIAKLALFSLLAASVRRGFADFTVYVVIDEFQQIVTENLAIILEQARHNRLNCILSHQNLSQLDKPPAGNLIPVVQGNTRFKQVFSASDLAQQKAVMDASGEALYHMADWGVGLGDFEAGNMGPRPPGFTDAGTERIHIKEQIGPVLRRNDIIEAGDAEMHSLVHITRSRGYTQFGGYTFPMRCEYHIPLRDYRARESAEWPEQAEGTITPMIAGPTHVPFQSTTPGPGEPPSKGPIEQERSRTVLLDKLEKRIDEIEGPES